MIITIIIIWNISNIGSSNNNNHRPRLYYSTLPIRVLLLSRLLD